jgi:ABC-2 type transport system permease protein
MVTTIARVEFEEIVRDGRFRLIAVVIGVLLLMALAAGWRHFSQTSAQRDLAQRDAREVWLGQDDKNPHSAAHFGTYAFRPPAPLSLVDTGIDPYVGNTIYLEAHKQNDSEFTPSQDRTALQRFGELTASTVLQILLPLVIVILTFNSLSGEREAGTLKQVLSLGISGRTLLCGKALGISAALALLAVPAVVIGGAALWFSSSFAVISVSIGRMLWMEAGYLLYFSTVLGLALAVSARASSPRLALIVVVGYWMVNMLVAPRIASDISTSVSPQLSTAEFQSGIEEDVKNGMDGHNPQDRRVHDLLEKTLKAYGVSRIKDLPVNFSGIALQAAEEYGNQVFDRHYRRRWDSYERQARIQQLLGLAAPILAIRALSMGMAGTDFAHYRHFAGAAEGYRRKMVRILNNDLAYHSKPGQTYLAHRDVWERIQDFRYDPPDAGWVLERQSLSLSVLLIWFVASATAAVFAVSGIRVTGNS